jgi:transposase
MTDKSATRYEVELQKLKVGLSKIKGLKKYEKILERLGRLKGKYKQTAYLYTVNLESDDKKIVTDITWKKAEDITELKNKGIYCLRTNRMDLDAQTFWNMYVMLTDLESAFRSLKSELGLRPIYHQKEKSIDGHLFISTLAYHALRTIRCAPSVINSSKKIFMSDWQSLRASLRTHCRIMNTLQLENGKTLQL